MTRELPPLLVVVLALLLLLEVSFEVLLSAPLVLLSVEVGEAVLEAGAFVVPLVAVVVDATLVVDTALVVERALVRDADEPADVGVVAGVLGDGESDPLQAGSVTKMELTMPVAAQAPARVVGARTIGGCMCWWSIHAHRVPAGSLRPRCW